MDKKSLRNVLWASIGIAIVIPLMVGSILLLQGKPPLALPIALATSLVSFSAAPLFRLGLGGFKRELRRACGLLYFGIILYGIGQLQFPLLEAIHIPFWTESGLVVLPYFFAIGFIFFGMRRFAALVGIKTAWASLIWIPLVAIVGGGLMGALGQGDRAIPMAFETFLSVFLLGAAMTAMQIRKVVASRYHTFLAFLAGSFSMLIFTAIHDIVTTLVLPPDSWYSNNLSAIPTLLAATLFLLASYFFACINAVEKGQVKITDSPIDVITYLVGLASNPAELDPQLDDFRRITAEMKPGEPLNSGQEASLAKLYKNVELYLTTKEPLMSFTSNELRENIQIRFQFDTNTKSPFWRALKD